MLKIANDPFKVVLQAAEELWPDLKVDIQWNPTMKMNKKEYGCTIFPEDGSTPLIELNPGLKVKYAVEILGHELAHVVVGVGAGHGPEWQKAFEAIFDKYSELMKLLADAHSVKK